MQHDFLGTRLASAGRHWRVTTCLRDTEGTSATLFVKADIVKPSACACSETASRRPAFARWQVVRTKVSDRQTQPCLNLHTSYSEARTDLCGLRFFGSSLSHCSSGTTSRMCVSWESCTGMISPCELVNRRRSDSRPRWTARFNTERRRESVLGDGQLDVLETITAVPPPKRCTQFAGVAPS